MSTSNLMVLLNFEYVNIQVCKDKIGIWTYNSFSDTYFRSFQNYESFFNFEVFALKVKLPNGAMRPYNLAFSWSMAHVLRFGVSRSVEVVNFLQNILSICILPSHERSIFRFSPWGKLASFLFSVQPTMTNLEQKFWVGWGISVQSRRQSHCWHNICRQSSDQNIHKKFFINLRSWIWIWLTPNPTTTD